MKNQYIQELIEKLETIEFSEINKDIIYDYSQGMERLLTIFAEHRRKQSPLFFIGNGGSSAIASHMTADFMKNGGMKTCSLYDNAVITCMGNDYGYEYIFSKPLEWLLREGDLLVAISSSGNSPNIINAIQAAKQKHATVVTFTGFEPDNQVRKMGNVNVYVPCVKYGIVESIHNMMLQQLVDMLADTEGMEM